MKRILSVIAIILLLYPTYAFAHSGGTDANGGHHDYDNVSGLGSYHYHHGYGPHLHDGGICPYDDAADTSVSNYSSSNTQSIDNYSNDETYYFTEDELFDYVYEEVNNYPDAYDVIPLADYEELEEDYALLDKGSMSVEDSVNDTLKGVGITAAIGAVSCYLIYRKYRSKFDEGYKIGYREGGSFFEYHTYCGVVFDDFENNGKIYHYRTLDTSVSVGDLVVVPVGKDNDIVVARVVSIDTYNYKDVPYPLNKTRDIIKKG